ncbi:hypothetical protein E7T06_18185 [Deinococcus sp. Arct2-2]|uniref:hypothetical protein n=1 Tax=Deinococcus sp. Arct2-2 TaxID=2568653 RepID=UPI0010A41BB2|nr:hypothetical protein [Deinococcus sp. Arct2-2]THF68048.1 hypothetical protein E7T06_18185 [Deinococcus sp. Arct2-2]
MNSTDALINAIEELAAARYAFEKAIQQYEDYRQSSLVDEPNEERLLAARKQLQIALNAANK